MGLRCDIENLPLFQPIFVTQKQSEQHGKPVQLLCVWGEQHIYSYFVVICVWVGMFLKKVIESSLVSKEARLTPNIIDQVMQD